MASGPSALQRRVFCCDAKHGAFTNDLWSLRFEISCLMSRISHLASRISYLVSLIARGVGFSPLHDGIKGTTRGSGERGQEKPQAPAPSPLSLSTFFISIILSRYEVPPSPAFQIRKIE